MTKCRPLCAHRELVRDYHLARDAQLQAAESVTGGGWAARDDEEPATAVTFKEWLIGHATPEEYQ
jgi:nicotinamide mononucleotide (NMN) deamidase PncC